MIWKPSSSDLQWMKHLIDVLNNDGVWATSFAVYTVKKEEKKVIANLIGSTFYDVENHDRVVKAFNALQYDVEVRK